MVAPANDNFASAQVLTGTSGSVPLNNIDATFETGEPDNAITPYASGDLLAQTVWFRYTPTIDGSLNVATHGSTGDSTLEVFTGASLGSLTLIASDDDNEPGPGGFSLLDTPVTAGTTYHFRVDTWTYAGPAGTDETLTWGLSPNPPANDNFASRQTIASVSTSVDVTFDLVGSTLESGEQHTAGMVGSVWYEVTVPVDKYVLFEVPTGVEVRIYRGTATLAGMLYRNVSNDATRRAFNLGSAFTYFVKLQSASATESGTMHVRPFAWTDFRIPDPVQERGAEKFTRLNGSNTDGLTQETPFSAAWANAVAGTVTSSNQVSGSSLGTSLPLGWSINTNDGVSYFATLGVGVLSVEWGGTVGPLYASNWPTDPSGLDATLVDGLDFAEDPATFTKIEWDAGTASLVNDSGTVAFTAEADPLTDGSDARTLDFYVNPLTPPGAYTDIPAWPTLPGSGDDTLTLSYTPPSARGVAGGSAAAPYDLYSHLSTTHAALLVSPSAAQPALGTLDDGGAALADMRIRNVALTATLPVQYPAFKMYAPLPPGTRPPLRQWPRDDGLRRTPGRTYATSRQGSLRRGPRGSYT